jgi:hypothetical protein
MLDMQWQGMKSATGSQICWICSGWVWKVLRGPRYVGYVVAGFEKCCGAPAILDMQWLGLKSAAGPQTCWICSGWVWKVVRGPRYVGYAVAGISMYAVWIHISGKREHLARLFGEVAWLKVFYSALCLQIFMLQLIPPISHLIHRGRAAVYLSLLTPSILCHDDFVKSLATATPWPSLDKNADINVYKKAKQEKRWRRIREIAP